VNGIINKARYCFSRFDRMVNKTIKAFVLL